MYKTPSARSGEENRRGDQRGTADERGLAHKLGRPQMLAGTMLRQGKLSLQRGVLPMVPSRKIPTVPHVNQPWVSMRDSMSQRHRLEMIHNATGGLSLRWAVRAQQDAETRSHVSHSASAVQPVHMM